MTLEKGVIRGAASNGMLCSAAELELSEDHDGIIELPDDAPIGQKYVEYAKLNGVVFDISLTPNRGDATGVARHRARSRGVRSRQADDDRRSIRCRRPRGRARSRSSCSFAEGEPKACKMFAGRLIRGRQERAVARVAAGAAARRRAASDLGAGRYHQLHHARPRPAAPRLRCRQDRGHRARADGRATAKSCRRSTARPTRSIPRSA